MKTFPLLASVTALAATPAFSQATAPMAPDEYVTTAGAGDLYEIQSSQIVLQSTTDPMVRAFAQGMVRDHTKSTAMVTAAATKSRVAVPLPQLMPLQAELIAELQAENGPSRDAAYIAQQKAAHQQALNVQKAYAMEGTAPALKGAAAKIVPVVQGHIKMLMKM